MILVCLGNATQPFPRMVDCAERAFRLFGEREIIWQLGSTERSPSMGKCFRRIEREEFANLLNDCEIVLTHGGAGTVMEAIQVAKVPLVMSRRKEFGEIVDNHQLQLVSALCEMGAALPAETEIDIIEGIKLLRSGSVVQPLVRVPSRAKEAVRTFLTTSQPVSAARSEK